MLFRPTNPGRFRAEALFQPESVALVGGNTPLALTIQQNMLAAGFRGSILSAASVADIAALPTAPDLAVIATEPHDAVPALSALAQRGTFAAICATPVEGLTPGTLNPERWPGLRMLGPGSFGIIVPKLGLNASSGHLQPRLGKLALVSQSAALCRAVLDWAEPNGVGFSHVVGTGADADISFGLVLDWLSRDPGTGAILLDIRTVTNRRAFLSAARAAARLRPVVAIRAGGRMGDPAGRGDAVFEAALRRAGILRATCLADLLAAAETLTRARPARSEAVAVVTNAIGPGQMATDEAVRLGIPLAVLNDSARTVLRLSLPPQPENPGLVWTGDDQPTRVADTVAMLSAAPEIGGIVAVLAPTGAPDAAGAAALAAALPALKVPLLACVLGETTAAAHRLALAEAGVPVFATPEQAMRGFAQLVHLRRARETARELPSSRVLRLAPDHATVRRVFATARRSGRLSLLQEEALEVLSAYGMPIVPSRATMTADDAADAAGLLGFPAVVKLRRSAQPQTGGPGAIALDLPDAAAVRRAARGLDTFRNRPGLSEGFLVQRQIGRARELRISVTDDPLFGPAIGFGQGGSAADLLNDFGMELPPLNLALASGLIGRTRAATSFETFHDQPAANRLAVADALVRVSQLVMDFPEIAELDLNPLFADADGVSAADGWIMLRPLGETAHFGLPAYPAGLEEHWTAGSERLLIRPIRPEDAEAHIALFHRLTPEDVRYRFFSVLRTLSNEQIARLTQVDYDREIAFVAVREGTGETVGVSRLVREGTGETGEFAIVVESSMKGRGLARRLMQRLIDWGRSQDMHSIAGQVLSDNQPMLAFMRRMGFAIHALPDEPDVVEAAMMIEDTALPLERRA